MQDQRDRTTAARSTGLQTSANVQKDDAPTSAVQPLQPDPLAQVSCRVGDNSCASAHAATLNRATSSQPGRAGQSLLALQRQYGNRYVQEILGRSRTAEGEPEATPELEKSIQQARAGGQALDSTARGKMESAFGADFGGVRVHTGPESHALNRELSARAFTTGQDIFFARGEYNPGSSSGRELITHELTHVVQQRGDEVQPALTVGRPGDIYEQEAEQVAREFAQQEGALQRQVPEEEEEKGLQMQALPDEEEEEVRAQRSKETKENSG